MQTILSNTIYLSVSYIIGQIVAFYTFFLFRALSLELQDLLSESDSPTFLLSSLDSSVLSLARLPFFFCRLPVFLFPFFLFLPLSSASLSLEQLDENSSSLSRLDLAYSGSLERVTPLRYLSNCSAVLATFSKFSEPRTGTPPGLAS